MWRTLLVTLKCPLLSELGFHYTLTDPVTDSCARGISADPLGNVLVRHHRRASCLANAVLALSSAFNHVHKTKISVVSKQTLLVSVVTGICKYHTWIYQRPKCEKYWWEKDFFEVAEETKQREGCCFIYLLFYQSSKRLLFQSCTVALSWKSASHVKKNKTNHFSEDYCILMINRTVRIISDEE